MLFSAEDRGRFGKNAVKFYDENLSVKSGIDSFEKVFNDVAYTIKT